MTERCILSVQIRRIGVHDEELGACAVVVLGTRHGDHAPLMGNVVLIAVGTELAHDFGVAAAGSISIGVTALHHKAFDDAVESQPVVEPALCQ